MPTGTPLDKTFRATLQTEAGKGGWTYVKCPDLPSTLGRVAS
jgi:hypothetical protein